MRSDHVYIGKIKYRSVSNYCKLIANCEPSKAKRTRLIVNKFISKRSEHVYVKNFKKQSEAKWFIFKFTNIYSYLTNTATFTCKNKHVLHFYFLFTVQCGKPPPPTPQELYKNGEKRGRSSLIAEPFLYSVISMI